MAVMIDGRFMADDPAPQTDADGAYRRAAATIRDWIGMDGPYRPEPGRYHIYAAWNCPWAHRVLLARVMLGLEDAISVAFARPRRTADGWVYDTEGEFADPVLGVSALHQVYARHRPRYTGRLTVPVLWDRETGRIVNNESADIVRMLSAFGSGPGLRPPHLAGEIDDWNMRIYGTVNNGVYRAGFARTQAAYDSAVTDLFETLDRIEVQLTASEFLTGARFTEADLRLFPTLARFDVAYHYAFKCNIRRLVDCPALWAYARRIYAMPRIAGTVNFDYYKQGYFSPSELRNPLGIIPAGPLVDWTV